MKRLWYVVLLMCFCTVYSVGLAQQEAPGFLGDSTDKQSGRSEGPGRSGVDESGELTLGIIAPRGHPIETGSRYFARLVEEQTNGALSITIKPAGSLGNELELQQAARDGRVDMINIGCNITADTVDQFHIFHFPFVWKSTEHMRRFLDSTDLSEWNETYRKTSGLRVLASNWEQPVRHLLSKNHFSSIEEVNGLRVRVPRIETFLVAWEIVGAHPIPLAFSEVREALEMDTVEAVGLPLLWAERLKLHAEATFIIQTSHLQFVNQMQINDSLFTRLPEEQQNILRKAAQEAGEYANTVTSEVTNDAKQKLKSSGVTFIDIDRSPFIEKIETVAPRFKELWGTGTWETVRRYGEAY